MSSEKMYNPTMDTEPSKAGPTPTLKEEVKTILYDTKDTMKDAAKKTMGKVHDITEAAGEKIENAKENVMEKAHEIKEKVIRLDLLELIESNFNNSF